jgi:hypothetical protein
MKQSWMIWPLLALLPLAGCRTNPQLPVSLADHALTEQSGRVGVAMTALPKADTSFPGAYRCPTCMIPALAANSTLTKYTHTLTTEELSKLKDIIAERLRKKGVDVTVIAEDLNLSQLKDYTGGGFDVAKRDFRVLKDKFKVDRLVVVDFTSLGFVRNYASYFSKGDPTAELEGTVSVVNLSTNAYELYSAIHESKSADGAWDEPPQFPSLTNAYYAVLESGKDAIQESF